jgi:hypothetical protein
VVVLTTYSSFGSHRSELVGHHDSWLVHSDTKRYAHGQHPNRPMLRLCGSQCDDIANAVRKQEAIRFDQFHPDYTAQAVADDVKPLMAKCAAVLDEIVE